MADKWRVRVAVNPFALLPFGEAEDELEGPDLVRLLCARAPGIEDAVLLERYRIISSVAMEPPILPALPVLIEKIVSPLVGSKAAFVAGNPLGTIALCGFVAEMIALVTYEMARGEGPLADVTANEFESWPQERRMKDLYKHHLINRDAKKHFTNIRIVRRKYLHLLSKEHSNISEDALSVYASAVWLLVDLVGQEFDNGAWIPRPSFARYLSRHGLLESVR